MAKTAVRGAGALLALLGGCWLVPTISAAAGSPVLAASGTPPVGTASVPPGVVRGPDSVTLLAQSPWVEAGHDFHLRLQIAAHDPVHERIGVTVYSRLITRTDFDSALGGHVRCCVVYPLTLDLTKLRADPAGGVDIDIPVNQSATNPSIPTLNAVAGSGVFPVQIGLYDDSDTSQGQPFTTYLVYAEPPPATGGFPKLSVSVTLPFHAPPAVDARGQLGGLPAAESGALADLVARLGAQPGVRLSLAVTPQTLDTLAAGSALDRSTLVALAQLARGGRAEILPGTYVSVPLRGWDAAGLGGELARQLGTGSSVLAGVFGTAPSPVSWVVSGPLDDSALQTLVSRGATQLILPDVELSALPALARETTFAQPTPLLGPEAKTLVYGADPGLTADFSSPGGPVLAASQLLAELAMIQLETPGRTRGVAVLPPPGWGADPTFVSTLLAGLDGHPLLNPVTASGLFAAVPVAPVPRSIAVPEPSSSASTGPAPSTSSGAPTATTVVPGYSADVAAQFGADAGTIRSARQSIEGLGAVLPQDAQRAEQLDRELLTAESSDLTPAQRQSLLGAVSAAASLVTRQISLPGPSSITLTSTRGQIPLTVLSAPSLRARVELRLSSQRLIFHLFSPPDGKCRVPTPTSEVCDLTLTTRNNTVKVPVETRSSGVFPLDVSLWTPDGSQMLARNRDTVRSTAVSGVGIVLIVVAIVSLAIWWVRDLRHGRRARQLVPAPDDEAEDQEDPGGLGGLGGLGGGPTPAHAPVDTDAVVRDFFSTPPPDYQERPARPHP